MPSNGYALFRWFEQETIHSWIDPLQRLFVNQCCPVLVVREILDDNLFWCRPPHKDGLVLFSFSFFGGHFLPNRL